MRASAKSPYLLLGSIAWMLNIQYFITQYLVAQAWTTPFSLLHNTISDLGNTACGPYGGHFVCSPAHGWMNASFIVLGLCMSLGAVLLYRQFGKGAAGFGFLVLAGLGTILVGLFPEDTVSSLHVAGATLPFLLGNVALVMLGFSLRLPQLLRYYTVISGVVALGALVLFQTHTYLGIGVGGTERVVAYPQTGWMIVAGGYLLRRYFKP